jgi:hypothetical protein
MVIDGDASDEVVMGAFPFLRQPFSVIMIPGQLLTIPGGFGG